MYFTYYKARNFILDLYSPKCMMQSTFISTTLTYNYTCTFMKVFPSSFRIASADFTGFLRIWKIQDLLQETEKHLMSAVRKKKQRVEPLDFVEHRSTYSHRHHITMVRLDAFRVITCSRDQTVLIQDMWKKIL